MTSSSTRPFAVVTGASSGIGFELALQFAQHGFDLLIASASGKISDAEMKLRNSGAAVESVEADLATREGVEKLYQSIQAYGRPLEAIAINAGVGVGGAFAAQTDLEAELNIINLNVTCPVHLTKLVLKDMVARKQGRILFTSSLVATMPASFLAVYGALTAAVRQNTGRPAAVSSFT